MIIWIILAFIAGLFVGAFAAGMGRAAKNGQTQELVSAVRWAYMRRYEGKYEYLERAWNIAKELRL